MKNTLNLTTQKTPKIYTEKKQEKKICINVITVRMNIKSNYK